MKRYFNSSSGIAAYEVGPDYIVVKFKTGSTYRYSYAKAGNNHVETMKRLARRGRGLNSYINRYVKHLYD